MSLFIFPVVFLSMTTFAFCQDLTESDSQIWKVGQRRWTIQEEYNYCKWIEKNIPEDFFIHYKIPVDCADVPYALRWIYARISHLPAAATTVDNQLTGHWSKDWRHLPKNEIWHKDKRFRAALIAMLSTTSTKTLPSDTYPVRITADSLTAGTVFLIAEEHTGIVSHLVMDGSTTHPVQTLEAGMPTRIQRLFLRNFISPDLDPGRISGFRKFRWPVEKDNQWHYFSAKEHPFYSEEQYLPSFTKGYAGYIEAVARRIDPKIYDPNEKAQQVINTLARRLAQRIPIVLEGNKKCYKKNQCEDGSLYWEIYSTPDRDEFIDIMVEYLEEIINKNNLDRKAILEKMAKIRLQISPGRVTTLKYIFQNFKWMSSDPEATIDARWAINKCDIIALHLKDAQESISFIKKRYGKSDPLFAERSIRTQQAIIDEMIKESRKNKCKTEPANIESFKIRHK
ncbi:MAG: hypothetical protein ABFD50_05320 [Smithella sp.]